MTSDEQLVEKIKAGDVDSFESLVIRYRQKIFGFIFRMVYSQEDAMDLTQEVFVQLYRSLASFRGEAKFSAWLYRIASNKSLDFLRKNAKLRTVGLEKLGDLRQTDSAGDPEDSYLRAEQIIQVRNIIDSLPDKYRLVLTLFHYENLSYLQIADILGVPSKTVATRLYRAKLILKEKLGGEESGLP